MSAEPIIERDTREPKLMDPFLGDVLTAMFTQSGNLSNAVIDGLEADKAQWARSFAGLYDKLSELNETVDSARIERLLDGFAPVRTHAEMVSDHYTGPHDDL